MLGVIMVMVMVMVIIPKNDMIDCWKAEMNCTYTCCMVTDLGCCMLENTTESSLIARSGLHTP